MKIGVYDVLGTLQMVLDGQVTREDADRWAYAAIQKSESNELIFFPASDEEKIWEGLMFLYGIDSKDSPNEYLHSDEDIRQAIIAINKP